MSTATQDHRSVDIDDEHSNTKSPQPTSGGGGKPETAISGCTARLSEGYYLLKQCLQKTGSKSIRETEMAEEKTEEGKAYKKLFEDMEGEPTDHPFSVIMWVVHFILLVIFIILVTTFASVHVIHKKWLLHMRVHSWVALLMVLVSGYPFTRFATFVVSEPFVWVWKMNKYVYFFARSLKKSVDVTLWFTLVLWVWYTWFRSQVVKDTRGAKTLDISVELYKEELKGVVKQVTRMLMALSIGALIWTMKSAVFLKLLADLHYTELCERIRRTILDLHGIQFIENKGQWSFLTHVKTSKKDTYESGGTTEKGSCKTNIVTGNNNSNIDKKDQGDALSFWMCVARLKKKTAPIWILKRLTYTYLEHMKKKPEILRRLENVDDDEKLVEEAKNMLLKVIDDGQPHSDDITRKDLRKYGLDDKEIDHVLELFTSKEDEKPREIITQDQFLRWAVLAVKNCLGLERTLQSSQHIFWKLDVLLSSCVVVITLVIWLLLSELVNTSQIAILFAPFLSATFIFGESLRRSFDGIMFVFGMHPFDLGDRVIIDTVEMKVSEMNIMTTIFIKYDTGVEVIYPNSELSTKYIINLDITPDQPDIIEFNMPIDTPEELIFDLQVKIKKTLDDNLTYTSNTAVAKKSISDTEVTLIVYFKYLVSYLSAETKALHRSRIFCEIIKLRKEIELLKKKRMEQEDLSQKETNILRFTIDVKVKMDTIDKLKDIVMRYNPSLKDGSQVLFISIDKREIIMDARMCMPRGKIKELIEGAIDAKFPNLREEKKVQVSWLPRSDGEDHC